MSWNPSKIAIWMLCGAFLFTGCTPSSPVYKYEGDLSYYIEEATRIDYPDVATATLDEVTQAHAPITVIDPDFLSFYDLSLEDCVGMALQNNKVFRGYGTPSLQGTRVAPGIDNLANGPAAAGTIYNVAIRETEPGFIGTPGQISGPGSITTNTGLEGNQGVEAALADFDAQFTSSLIWTNSDEPRNTIVTSPFNPLVFQQDQVQWQAEIAKKTANGTQIFFRNVNQYTDNNIPLEADGGFQNLGSWYRAALEFEVRQPLLRGRGAFIQRMPIVISRIGTDQELANLEAVLQNMVTNIEIRYWELYCAYRNLDAAKTGRDAALETWRIIDDQFQEGADVNKQQRAQAAEQYYFFSARVTEALNNLLSAEGNLRFLLGIASTDGRLIRPIDEAVMAPIEFDWCNSLCEALTYRPELRQERWEIKKRELSLAYAKNSLLPELNVTGLYRWLGLGNRFATSEGDLPFPAGEPGPADPFEVSGALNELYGGNYGEFQFGLDYRMPVGFRRELSNVRNAQLKLARELALL
ncbi:MAG: TolC family protein [Planctomycetota bacterium]